MKNNKTILIIILVILLIGLIGGVTYAIFTTEDNSETMTIQTGAITFTYNEPSSNVTIANAYPTTDANGMTNDYFQFTVSSTATGQQNVNYWVYFVLDSNNTFPTNSIKMYLTRVLDNEEYEIDGYPKFANSFSTYENGYLLDNGTFENFADTLSITYRLRMWIDENYEDNSSSKTFRISVNTYGTAIPE